MKFYWNTQRKVHKSYSLVYSLMNLHRQHTWVTWTLLKKQNITSVPGTHLCPFSVTVHPKSNYDADFNIVGEFYIFELSISHYTAFMSEFSCLIFVSFIYGVTCSCFFTHWYIIFHFLNFHNLSILFVVILDCF